MLVTASAVLLGYYAWIALASPSLPTYRLDFEPAQWIGTAEDKPVGYFIKKCYINSQIDQAWIQIASTDSFRLFVNNSPVHNPDPSAKVGDWTANAISADPSLICDISKYLRVGTNTIGINVLRSSYPGRARVIVRGLIREPTSQQEIVSDRSWKASSQPGFIANLVPWTDPLLDDNLWPNATVLPKEGSEDLIQPVAVPPRVFQSAVKGRWIGTVGPTRNQGSFSKCFDIPVGAHHTWLQVAAIGEYTVTLNGHWLGDFRPATSTIQFISLDHWIKNAGNDLAIRVRSADGLPFLIGEVSFLSSENRIVSSVATDQNWTVYGLESEANASRRSNAQEVRELSYAPDHWGIPPKEAKVAALSFPDTTCQTIFGLLLMIGVALGVFLGWLGTARVLSWRRSYSLEDGLSFDALIHLPVLFLAALLLLLRYEIRLRPEWPVRSEFFFALLALLIGLRFVALILPPPKRIENQGASHLGAFAASPLFRKRGFSIALGVIVIFAFVVRIIGINQFPLDQDDIFIRNCAKGIFLRGYPSLDYGGVPVRLTTYELVPYPIALSALVFGWSDWAVRVPALVFGTLTTLTLGCMGRSLFNRRVGLFAALIYGSLPWNVFWSLHCFHPQQDQFFALLCIWSFYLAVRKPNGLDKKYFYLSCLYFCLVYFSWEGTGFLLPVFTLALVLMHPGRFGWLRQRHLWLGLLTVGTVVMIQSASRAMALPPYLALGYGLADLGTPELYFLDPQCLPFYYTSGILTVDPHLLLTICLCLGVFLVGQSPPTRYCLLVFGGLLLCFSVLLPAYSERYFYFYQTILILGACGIAFELCDRIIALAQGWRWPLGDFLARGGATLGLLLLFVSTTNRGLMLYRLSGSRPSQVGFRYGLRWQDSSSSARFVAAHLRRGDIVIANLTQAFELYGGRLPDYSTDPLLGARIVYNRDRPVPRYEHRDTSIPMIHNLNQVQEILQMGGRVWYISTSQPNANSPMENSVSELLTRRSRVVYSSYSSLVYLWEGLTPIPEKTAPDLALPPRPPLPNEFGSVEKAALDPVNPPEAQLPLKWPLKPAAAFQPEMPFYRPNEPSEDAELLPSTKSLQPLAKPTPSPANN